MNKKDVKNLLVENRESLKDEFYNLFLDLINYKIIYKYALSEPVSVETLFEKYLLLLGNKWYTRYEGNNLVLCRIIDKKIKPLWDDLLDRVYDVVNDDIVANELLKKFDYDTFYNDLILEKSEIISKKIPLKINFNGKEFYFQIVDIFKYFDINLKGIEKNLKSFVINADPVLMKEIFNYKKFVSIDYMYRVLDQFDDILICLKPRDIIVSLLKSFNDFVDNFVSKSSGKEYLEGLILEKVVGNKVNY